MYPRGSSTPIPEQFPEVFDLWRSGELSARAAADRLGVSARTFTRWTADTPKTEKNTAAKGTRFAMPGFLGFNM